MYYDPDSSLYERITYLKYYESFVPSDNKRNKRLDKIFMDIRAKREQDAMDAPEYCNLMEKIIDAILYTRNINDGRGERDLTYSYIYTLQHHLPIKAIFVLYMLVENGVGSWRDPRDYVEYIGDLTNPFVKPIIGLYNKQLEKDWAAYQAGNMDRISYAAKWVPREKKGRRHLFDALVQMWAFRDPEYKRIMETAANKGQYVQDLALNKCKKMYRTMISKLNAVLSENDATTVETVTSPARLVIKPTTPLWRIVKCAAHGSDMENIWTQRLKPLPKDYYVPLLDVSEPMYENGGKSLYKAIIKACQYAYASHFGPNIIVFSHKPEWISIEGCTLAEVIDRVRSTLFVPYTGFKEAFELVHDAAKAAGMDDTDMDKLRIKLLSCQPLSVDYMNDWKFGFTAKNFEKVWI